ncbi:MAG: glycosyltransferase family 8 protein [Variovorax sp.]|jgi:lipopolysaccharide biosynthesis glycosyltransferase|nr:MAG: glycosyltransferase family 8 protein [Variovorax sp.]
MNIVFNVNPLGLEGLGVTVVSMVRNCSDSSRLMLNFLCSELSAADKSNIVRLLAECGFRGQTHFIDFDAQKEFGSLRPLHGDWTAYGRLLIPDVITADRVLYLDADLSVNLDVLDVEKTVDLDGHFLAAVAGSTLKWALDGEFLKKSAGMDDDMPYFNSGVVYFNVKACREHAAATAWRAFAAANRDGLVSHDQTVLNAYVKGDFVHLESRYNVPWIAGKDALEPTENAIVHYIGAPKPWDLGGRLLHRGQAHWARHQSSFWNDAYSKLTLDKIRRTWKIRRSIAKVVLWRFKAAG